MRRSLESHHTDSAPLLDTTAASSGGAVPSPAVCRRPCRCKLSARVSATLLISCVTLALLLAFRARRETCPPVPDTAVIAAMEAADAEVAADASVSVAPNPRAPHFFLIWSTSASSFSLVPGRCLESIFYHHPHATVTIYSNQLPAVTATPGVPVLHQLRQHGYNVCVRPYNLSSMLAGTPSAPWLSRMDEWRRGPYFYSHVTDVLRLAILFRHGGVYLDSDIILLRPLRIAGLPATLARPPPDGAPHAELRDALGIESFDPPPPSLLRRLGLALSAVGGTGVAAVGEGDTDDAIDSPGVAASALGRVPMLNGAILVFPFRHSRFLWSAMAEFAATYHPRRWGWNGPELLTRVALARCSAVRGVELQLHPPDTFYPIYWRGLERFAAAPDGRDALLQRRTWQRLRRRAYTAHLWNRKTAELEMAPGSLLHRLLHTWTVLPTSSSLEGGGAGKERGRNLGSAGRANVSVGRRVRL